MKDYEIKGTAAWLARGPELASLAAELQDNWHETRVGLVRNDLTHQISAEVHIRAGGETVVRYRLLSYDGYWQEYWFDSITDAVSHVMQKEGLAI